MKIKVAAFSTLFLASPSFGHVEVSQPTINSYQRACKMASRTVLRRTESDSETIRQTLGELAKTEGTTVIVKFDSPVSIDVVNLNLVLSTGKRLPRARISSPPSLLTQQDGRIDYRGPGPLEIKVEFTLLGICPFVHGQNVTQAEAVQAVESIFKVLTRP